jgi:hypothetical protein
MRRAAVSKWWKCFRDGETNVKSQNRLFHYLPELAANGLQHVFEKWVQCCKKFIACQGRYIEEETVTAPPQNLDSE